MQRGRKGIISPKWQRFKCRTSVWGKKQSKTTFTDREKSHQSQEISARTHLCWYKCKVTQALFEQDKHIFGLWHKACWHSSVYLPAEFTQTIQSRSISKCLIQCDQRQIKKHIWTFYYGGFWIKKYNFQPNHPSGFEQQGVLCQNLPNLYQDKWIFDCGATRKLL